MPARKSSVQLQPILELYRGLVEQWESQIRSVEENMPSLSDTVVESAQVDILRRCMREVTILTDTITTLHNSILPASSETSPASSRTPSVKGRKGNASAHQQTESGARSADA